MAERRRAILVDGGRGVALAGRIEKSVSYRERGVRNMKIIDWQLHWRLWRKKAEVTCALSHPHLSGMRRNVSPGHHCLTVASASILTSRLLLLFRGN
jgi:hypothetical protein